LPRQVTVSYTFDHFIVRDENTDRELYKVPYSVYEQMHALVVADAKGDRIIERVRKMSLR